MKTVRVSFISLIRFQMSHTERISFSCNSKHTNVIHLKFEGLCTWSSYSITFKVFCEVILSFLMYFHSCKLLLNCFPNMFWWKRKCFLDYFAVTSLTCFAATEEINSWRVQTSQMRLPTSLLQKWTGDRIICQSDSQRHSFRPLPREWLESASVWQAAQMRDFTLLL